MGFLKKVLKVDYARKKTQEIAEGFDKIDTGQYGIKAGVAARKLTGIDSKTAFRYGVSTMGGGMGWMYEHNRNKGMSDSQATNVALYPSPEMMSGSKAKQEEGQIARDAQARDAQALADYQNRQRLNEKFQAGQIASRVRRSGRSNRPGNKGGTLVTGGLGLPSGNSQISFASLLGL